MNGEQLAAALMRHGLDEAQQDAPRRNVALNANPKSEQGRRGLGYVAVRYYDPR